MVALDKIRVLLVRKWGSIDVTNICLIYADNRILTFFFFFQCWNHGMGSYQRLATSDRCVYLFKTYLLEMGQLLGTQW